jgi:hypothetical protein
MEASLQPLNHKWKNIPQKFSYLYTNYGTPKLNPTNPFIKYLILYGELCANIVWFAYDKNICPMRLIMSKRD